MATSLGLEERDFLEMANRLSDVKSDIEHVASLILGDGWEEKNMRVAKTLILHSLGFSDVREVAACLESDQLFEETVLKLLRKEAIARKQDEKERVEYENLSEGDSYQGNEDLIMIRKVTVHQLLNLVKNLKAGEKELMIAKKEFAVKGVGVKKDELNRHVHKLQKEYSSAVWRLAKKFALACALLAVASLMVTFMLSPTAGMVLAGDALAKTIGFKSTLWLMGVGSIGSLSASSLSLMNLRDYGRYFLDLRDKLNNAQDDFNKDISYNRDMKEVVDFYDPKIESIKATIHSIGNITDALTVQSDLGLVDVANERGMHVLRDGRKKSEDFGKGDEGDAPKHSIVYIQPKHK